MTAFKFAMTQYTIHIMLYMNTAKFAVAQDHIECNGILRKGCEVV